MAARAPAAAPAPKGPVRLQLSREPKFNLQKLSLRTNGLACRKVDRVTEWGNPYVVLKEREFSYSVNGPKAQSASSDAKGDFATREAALAEAVRLHAVDCERIAHRVRAHLAGVNLACWCAIGSPCHADTLVRIANQTPDAELQTSDKDSPDATSGV